MRIVQSNSKSEAAQTVAMMMVDHVASHPTSVLGLATGMTMVPVYEAWDRLAKERKLDHSGVFFFLHYAHHNKVTGNWVGFRVALSAAP